MCLIHYIGGAFTQPPQELSRKISQSASDLIKRAFDDVDPARLVDHHVHIAGKVSPFAGRIRFTLNSTAKTSEFGGMSV